MGGGQRAAEVQPAGTRQDAGHDLGAAGPAAGAVPAVLAGLAPVVLAQGFRDAALADTAPAARPVQQVPLVQADEPGRDLPAGCSRFPGRELVQPVESSADVRIGDEPVLSLGRRGVFVMPGADRAGRFAGQYGEPFHGRGRCPRECLVKNLLHFRPWPQAGFLVPGGDRAYADSQVLGERLVAHPQRGLQRARGAAGPARHQVHDPPPGAEMSATGPCPAQAPG